MDYLDTNPRDERDARYASHVPVITHYLAGRRWPVLEFGCGRFSTPLLARYGPPPDPQGFRELLRARLTPHHAVFSDGSPNSWRAIAVREAMARGCRLIFAHDWTKGSTYGYDCVLPHPAYKQLVYRCEKSKIRTAVWIHREHTPPARDVRLHTLAK